jgi:hypothetical protein
MVFHFVNIQKTGPKNRPENDHLKYGRSGIRSFTVLYNFILIQSSVIYLHPMKALVPFHLLKPPKI